MGVLNYYTFDPSDTPVTGLTPVTGWCGGIWFDNFELEKFDEPREIEEGKLLNIQKDSSIKVDYGKKRLCPRCENVAMFKHFFDPKKEFEVDECPACGRIWLDAGELTQIRDQYETEEERRTAARKCFAETFGSQIQSMLKESEEKRKQAGRIAHALRFICPSYYIPGKQDWGAF